MMKVDNVFTVVGEFGWYQVSKILILTILLSLGFSDYLSFTIIFYVPQHTCSEVPVLIDNNTLSYLEHNVSLASNQNSWTSFLPYNQADLFDITKADLYSKYLNNDSSTYSLGEPIYPNSHMATESDPTCAAYSQPAFWADEAGNLNISEDLDQIIKRKCNHWSFLGGYPYGPTAAADFEMVCDSSWKKAVAQSMVAVGFLIGAFICGQLSDLIGRLRAMCIVALLKIMFSWIIAFTWNYYIFLASFCALCATHHGLFIIGYVYMVEITGPKKRLLSPLVQGFFDVFQSLYGIMLYFFIKNWRYIEIYFACVGVTIFIILLVLDESPLWLISKTKYTTAQNILIKMAKLNKVSVHPEHLHEYIVKSIDQLEPSKKYTLLDISKNRSLRSKALILSINWMAVAGGHYAIFFSLPNLMGDPYVNLLVLLGVSYPFQLLAFLAMAILGRRLTFVAFMMLGSVFGTFILFFESNQLAITLLSLSAATCMSVSFTIIYVWTSEIYPTTVRNSGLGLGSITGRVAMMLVPFFLLLGTTAEALILCFCFVAAFLSLFLPETNMEPLPQTFLEAEENPLQKFSEVISLQWVLYFRNRKNCLLVNERSTPVNTEFPSNHMGPGITLGNVDANSRMCFLFFLIWNAYLYARLTADLTVDCPADKFCYQHTRDLSTYITFENAAAPENIIVTLIGEISDNNRYFSFGLTQTASMDDAEIYLCYKNGSGDLAFQHGYTSSARLLYLVTSSYLTGITTSSISTDVIQCQFTRPITTSANNAENLNVNLYLIQASGAMSGSTANQHSFRRKSSATYNIYDILNPTIAEEDTFASNVVNCGRTLGCWVEKDWFVISWQHLEESASVQITMEATLPSSSAINVYLGLGLSYNQHMDKDEVFICYVTSDGVSLSHGYIDGKEEPPSIDPEDYLLNKRFVLKSDFFKCSFTRQVTPEDSWSDHYYDFDQSFYLLAATGSLSGSALVQHNQDAISNSKVNLVSDLLRVETDEDIPALVIVHGSLMSFSWCILVPLAVFALRFYRNHWVKEIAFGKPLWFLIHASLNPLATVITVGGAIVILIHGDWHFEFDDAHSLIGFIIVGCSLVMLISGIFRPSPAGVARPAFNTLHRFIGITISVLAIFNLYLGAKKILDKWDGNELCYIFYGTSIAVIVLTYLTLTYNWTSAKHTIRENITTYQVSKPCGSNSVQENQQAVEAVTSMSWLQEEQISADNAWIGSCYVVFGISLIVSVAVFTVFVFIL